ncbi:MAG: hypothetical protein JXA60_09290 [Candidatus Coatesbacteria bacterium]|nr:hypothetical protein [Candidatus Coatesbacteria bacterium]
MNRILVFLLLFFSASISLADMGDRIASYPLPEGYNVEQNISGLTVSKDKIYIVNYVTRYIYRGDVNTGTWEKSWLPSGIDPYAISISFSGDTLAVADNTSKRLYFLGIEDMSNKDYVQLDENGYYTGCLYMIYKGDYRVLVVDRDNFKLCEVDPILMQYKGNFNAPSDISYSYWLRGIGYDYDLNCIVWAVTCFNEGATQLDSSMIVAYDPRTWTRRYDQKNEGHLLVLCAVDTLGEGKWFNGDETYLNIRCLSYYDNFTSNQTTRKQVYIAAGINKEGFSPQAVYIYVPFHEEGIKKETWGGIKKMYASNLNSIKKPSSSSAKTASRDISTNRNTLRRIFIPKRVDLR